MFYLCPVEMSEWSPPSRQDTLFSLLIWRVLSAFTEWFLVWAEWSWQDRCRSRLSLLASPRQEPWLLSVSHHAGYMINDTIEFSILKQFLLLVIKQAGENTFSAIQMNAFLSHFCLLILKNLLVDLFYVKHCYVIGLPGRDSHCHPFQEVYFLSKKVKFGEGSLFF